MHAAVFYGPNNIANEEIYCSSDYFSRDQIEFGEGILLRVKACAVCGYDIRVYRNGHHKVTPPVVLGHEICAEIDKTILLVMEQELKVDQGLQFRL